MVIDDEVPGGELPSVASSLKFPAVWIARSVNFATPLTALTVRDGVPTIVPVALIGERDGHRAAIGGVDVAELVLGVDDDRVGVAKFWPAVAVAGGSPEVGERPTAWPGRP